MKKLLSICLFISFFVEVIHSQKVDDLNLSAMIQPADSSQFVRDSEYFNWCNSVIKDEEGIYHLFYSRWPRKLSFFAWLTHSEIAHATSKKMTGPYLYKETGLKARPGFWDSVTAHNVQVNKLGDSYYMYYTSTNTGNSQLTEKQLQETALTGYSHPNWNLLRSNQRAGVAIASSLNGPWERLDHPLLEPQVPIYTVAVNPSVCQGKDGRYYLIIKGDNNPSPKRHLIQAIGTSDNPTGPFVLERKPAFSDIPTEDVCVWFDKKRERFYALFHAHGGNFIGMITSEDGINWEKAKNYQVCKKEIPLKDGTVMKVDRMERPYVYLEDGEIKMLSFGVKKGNDSFIVFFRCK